MGKTKAFIKKMGKPHYLFWIFILILVGQFIGLFLTQKQFQIENKIDLLDILSLSITVILAVLVSMIFDKNKSDHRVLKDIFINRISDIERLLSEFERLVNSPRVSLAEVTFQSKKISMSYYSLTENLKAASILEGGKAAEIKPNWEEFRVFITQFTSDLNCTKSSDASESNFEYYPDFLRLQSSQFTSLYNQFLTLQILINET